MDNKSTKDKIAEYRDTMAKGRALMRLQAELEKEVDAQMELPAEEIDVDYVNACEDLLWKLTLGDERAWPSRKKETWEAIERKLNEKNKTSVVHSRPFQIALVCAGVLVAFLAIDAIFGNISFRTTQSVDEQQYIIDGVDPAIRTIPQAKAALEIDEVLTLQTEELVEMAEFLGYVPLTPRWLPEGWESGYYTAHIWGEGHSFAAAYEKADEEYLISYSYETSNNAEELHKEFEQNAKGEMKRLNNGPVVYLSENMGSGIAVWIQGNGYYSLSAPVSLYDIEKIIASIE